MKRQVARHLRVGVGALAAAALLLGACGGDDDSAAPDDTSGAEESPTTGTDEGPPTDTSDGGSDYDPDATLAVTMDGPPTELDPHREPHTGARPYWTPVYDALTDIIDRSEVRPYLAASWEHSEDGLTWTFELRDDVEFHDGTPLDAEAVVTSINRARTLEGGTQQLDLGNVVDVVATGDYQVTFEMSVFDPKLPTVLGGPAGAILNPTAIAAGHDFSAQPDGSGPYVLDEHVPGERASYVRAPNEHWDPGTGKLAGFEISFLNDFPVAISGVRSGQIDASWVIGQNDLISEAVSADSNLVSLDFPPTAINALYLNNQVPLLGDRMVRQGIAYAIDREGLVNALFSGGADCVAVSQNYPVEGDPLYIPDFDPYPYDPELARSMFEEAGVAGQTIAIADIGSTVSRNIAQALQPMLEDAGLVVELQPGTVEMVQALQRREIDSLSLTSVAMTHPLISLTRYWMPGGAYPMAEGEHEELQRLADAISDPATSTDEAAGLYEEMAREMADLAVIIPICSATQHVLTSNEVQGLYDAAVDRINMRNAYVAS